MRFICDLIINGFTYFAQSAVDLSTHLVLHVLRMGGGAAVTKQERENDQQQNEIWK